MIALLQHRVLQSSALRVVALGMGILASVLIARLGGPEVKGVTSAFAASAILGFTIVNLDLAQQTLRDGRATGNLNDTRGRLVRLWPWYAAAATLIALAAVILGQHELAWITLGALAYLVSAHMGIACTGLSGPQFTAIGGIIQQTAMGVGALIAVWLGELDTSDASALVIASFLAPLPLYIWAARPRAEHVRTDSAPASRVTVLIRSGMKWQVARVAQLLLLRLDVLAVYWYLGSGAAGIYSVGLATSALAGLVPAQFASNTTYEATLGHIASLRRNAWNAARAGVVGAVILCAIGWPLMSLLYGHEFEGSFPVMLAALPGVVAYGVLQVFTNQMRIVGEARTVTIPSVIGVCAMTLGMALAMPTWGTVGAAAASSLGAMATVITIYVLWRGTRQAPASS